VKNVKQTFSKPDRCEWTFTLEAEINEAQQRRLDSRLLRPDDALARMMMRGFAYDLADNVPALRPLKKVRHDQLLFMLEVHR
jgi:hypothetical protein